MVTRAASVSLLFTTNDQQPVLTPDDVLRTWHRSGSMADELLHTRPEGLTLRALENGPSKVPKVVAGKESNFLMTRM